MYHIHPPTLGQIAVGAVEQPKKKSEPEPEPNYIRIRRATKDMLYPKKVLTYLDALMREHSKPDYTWAYAVGGFAGGVLLTFIGTVLVLDIITPEPTGVAILDFLRAERAGK